MTSRAGRLSARKHAAVAMAQCELYIGYLPRSGGANDLLSGLNKREQAIHAWVNARQSTAVCVHRKLAARSNSAALDETSTFAFGAESEIFQKEQRIDGERVVQLHNIDVRRLDTRLAISTRTRLRRRRDSQVRCIGEIPLDGKKNMLNVYGVTGPSEPALPSGQEVRGQKSEVRSQKSKPGKSDL